MSDRPIEDQLVALKKINVQITHNKNSDSNTPWVIVKGPAFFPVNQKLEVDCEKSTQFATALMLAFSDTTLKLDLLKLEASESYVKMTNQLIMDCSKQDSYCVPLDFSSLGYPAAIASLLGRVLIKNCTEIDALQADSEIIKLLKNAGASRSLSIDGLEIKKSKKLKPFTFNISQAPDLFPTLVFLAAHIEGTSCLDNLVVLQYKESDRLNEMINILKVFEVDFNYDPETSKLKINGRDNFKYKKATVECAKDHRIVMAAALFMAKNSGGELYNIDCVDKSYPNFLKLLEG
jgi:3-phosphoshikimate 1-carboxyvinyltransferase